MGGVVFVRFLKIGCLLRRRHKYFGKDLHSRWEEREKKQGPDMVTYGAVLDNLKFILRQNEMRLKATSSILSWPCHPKVRPLLQSGSQ